MDTVENVLRSSVRELGEQIRKLRDQRDNLKAQVDSLNQRIDEKQVRRQEFKDALNQLGYDLKSNPGGAE